MRAIEGETLLNDISQWRTFTHIYKHTLCQTAWQTRQFPICGGGRSCSAISCVWGGALDPRQCHSQSPSTLSHDSSQLAVSSSFLPPESFWQAAIWRTPLVQTHLPPLTSPLLFNFSSLPNRPPSSLHLSPSCPTPAHWSLSVLNVRDTFKDAFRSPLIIHTAWIINNNSHRAIIQLYHLSLSLPLFPLSLSTSCPRPFFSSTPYSLLKLLSLCDISFCLFGPLFQSFYVYHIFILFHLARHFFMKSASAFTVMDYLNMTDSSLILME